MSAGSGCAWFPDVLDAPARVLLDRWLRVGTISEQNKCLAYNKFPKNTADDQLGIVRSKYIHLVLHMNHSINEHL